MDTLKYTKFHKDAKITSPNEGDAGYDLYALGYTWSEKSACYIVDTGIGVEIPYGYVGIIKDRSGQALKTAETHAGVIDNSYRGPIKVLISKRSANSKLNFVKFLEKFAQMIKTLFFKKDENNEPDFTRFLGKFAQMIIVPCLTIPLEEKESLNETQRGSNGFGSTGA